MKTFVLAAALRQGSHNRKLAAQAAQALKLLGVDVEQATLREFEMPVYDGDLEDASGLPAGAAALAARLTAADAVVIASPEYNGGMSGALKNAIDWVSRADENPLARKPLLLLGASPGALGAVRGLWHARVPLEALGARVYPEMFGLPRAHEAFADDGAFKDAKNAERLRALVADFTEFAKRLRA